MIKYVHFKFICLRFSGHPSGAAVAAAAVASRRLSVLGAAANAANAANNSSHATGGLPAPPPPGPSASSSTARNPPSACTQFKNELSLLIKQINYTTPHYIRCIKPIDRSP